MHAQHDSLCLPDWFPNCASGSGPKPDRPTGEFRPNIMRAKRDVVLRHAACQDGLGHGKQSESCSASQLHLTQHTMAHVARGQKGLPTAEESWVMSAPCSTKVMLILHPGTPCWLGASASGQLCAWQHASLLVATWKKQSPLPVPWR